MAAEGYDHAGYDDADGIAARERKLGRAFVALADTLVAGYEVGDFLQMLCERVADVFDVDAVGMLLEAADGTLRLTAASTHESRALDLFEAQAEEGPCYEAYTRGEQILEEDLETASVGWERFRLLALDAGFRAVYAFPMRLRDHRLGAINMFRTSSGPFDEADVHWAQALADVATIGVLSERQLQRSEQRTEQLERALSSRVLIEQAKGALAERVDCAPEEAFDRMRGYARSHQRSLRDVCREVIAGELTP